MKDKKQRERGIGFYFVIMLICFTLGILAGIQIKMMNLDPEVDIPSGDEVSYFCKHYRGFDGGFLAGDCGRNKVRCYKNIGKSSIFDTDYTTEYECVWWASMEEKQK